LEQYGAIQLFAQTARMYTLDFALSAETAPAVVRICQLVDGLPLGIELAASWTRVLSCAEIAVEIAQNLDFLDSAVQDLPARQQSLRAVFAHSWNLLTPAEQQALRQLAVFRGSFTREAAAQVAAASLPLLASLVNKSLVRRVTTSGTGDVARYDLLEPLRQYAFDQLAGAGETAETEDRHAAYYLSWMADHTAALRGLQQRHALAAIGAEIAQVRAAWGRAVAYADGDAIARAADSLFHFYDMRSWFQEGAQAFAAASQALASHQMTENARLAWGKVLARQGWFTFHLGRQSEAKALLEQSLAILRVVGDRAEIIFTLNYLAVVCSYLGEYQATSTLCQESLEIAQAIDDQYGRAVACNILGQTAYWQGEYTAAQAWCQQSLAIEQKIGNRWSMAYSLTTLGKVAYAIGQYDEARWFFGQSLETREAVGDTRGVAICFNRLGDTAAALGAFAEAQERYMQSLALYREIGNQWGMAAALIDLGQLASIQAHDIAATCIFQEALRLALSTGAAPQVQTILAAFAPLLQRSGQQAWADELSQLVASELVSLAAYQPHAERLLSWSVAEPPGSAAVQAMTLEQALSALRDHIAAKATAAPPPAPAASAPLAPGGGRPIYPAGLTAREVDVLRLVAQGLTDAQVAEKLIVSTRTVSTHLTAIYGKLQVSSRSAATRFAIEHGLS
jgi:DNA-binding CsgD family transcriptional regulator/tetratricopeptide (TPR) repeat protein